MSVSRFTFACAHLAGNRSGRSRKVSRVRGRGKIFRSYLYQMQSCPSCREHFGKIHADDGPAWLTIIIVGLLFCWYRRHRMLRQPFAGLFW
jgi:uncharacterized protein (DUF983 family)